MEMEMKMKDGWNRRMEMKMKNGDGS